jgi:hypothetical protein
MKFFERKPRPKHCWDIINQLFFSSVRMKLAALSSISFPLPRFLFDKRSGEAPLVMEIVGYGNHETRTVTKYLSVCPTRMKINLDAGAISWPGFCENE